MTTPQDRMTTSQDVDPETGMTRITIHPGRIVVCDACNKEWTDSPESGGIMFRSWAVGPCCADRMTHNAVKYDEESNIRARCPEGKSFADWVREDIR